MKAMFWIPLAVALVLGAAGVWADDMQGMDMKDQAAQTHAAQTAKTHHAVGTVKRVDSAKGTVTISHGAVKTLNWPAMTMTFSVKDPSLLARFAPDKKVAVDFVEDAGDYRIVKVE